MFGSVGAGELQVERLGARTEHRRQHLEDRVDLVVAVLRRLDDLRVQAHGDVVDEDPLAQQREIDATFHRLAERVERADDVVPVETEVHGEMVLRAGRDTGEGDVVLPGHVRHERLRSVAPATPIASAPRATASLASATRSSPGSSTMASMPRRRASSTRP